jgi:predicted aldo/keto reductase-like oxidoreductase
MAISLPRRSFISGTAVALAACTKKREDEPPKASAAAANATMPMRPLGKTGVNVSIVGLGGFHIGIPNDEQESIRIIQSAVDRGVTFLDNCWDYHDGKSEERMGKALEGGYRQKAFLMTKVDGRTKKAAADQLEQSLKRLRTDVIDLVQMHEIIRATDPARCFAPGGAIEALVEAKKAGKLRFIGFTGHKDPDIHLAMLKAADDHHFTFDTVQMPLNVMDAHYRSFEKMVLPVLVQKGIAVLGMKSLGSGHILESKTASAVDCLHYSMSLPTSVVITGCEKMADLEQAIGAAQSFQPMDRARMTALLDKTRDAARTGRYERFKTSTQFDGTHSHPEWLEAASI